MATSRFWCFTLNNPVDPRINWSALSKVQYAVWQRECGESGTEHYQGYVECTSSVRYSYFKAALPGAHWERRMGTREQARDYCQKDDSRVDGPWIYGEWIAKEPGKRNDLARLKDLLDQGKSEKQILEEDFGIWARHYRAIERYHMLSTTPRDWKTELHILCGSPGCGKSKFCKEEAPLAYWKENNKWWDGYCGQEDIVIDDFYGWLPWNTLLRLTDRYPMNLETKGGTVVCRAKRVFITSNTLWTDWYKDPKCDTRALTRRITRLYLDQSTPGRLTLIERGQFEDYNIL
ncbi:MAG: putative viral replication protein [Cressdnaviricota sp.]|nr:MAG: putative viral replication protein [Cressdnaviricota sp.]